MSTRRAAAASVFIMLLIAFQIMTVPMPAHSATNWIVYINGGQFSPSTITVSVGDSVTWINNDGSDHSTVSNSGQADSWNSHDIPSGFNFTHTFSVVGAFQYYCDIHPEMVGTVFVQQPVPEFPGATPFTAVALCTLVAFILQRRLGTPRLD